MTRCERKRARREAPSSLSTTSTACPGSPARNVTSMPAQRPTGGAGDEVGGEYLVGLAVLARDHAVAAVLVEPAHPAAEHVQRSR